MTLSPEEEREIALEAGAVFRRYSAGDQEIVRAVLEPLEILHGPQALAACARHWCELAHDALPDIPWQMEIRNIETGEVADPNDYTSPIAAALVWASRLLTTVLRGDEPMIEALLSVVGAEQDQTTRVRYALAALRVTTLAIQDYEGKVALGMRVWHMAQCPSCGFPGLPFPDEGLRDTWAHNHQASSGHAVNRWPELR